MKPLSIQKLKKTVKEMLPGSVMIVRKADNQIMGYYSVIPACLELNYDIYMMYYREKKC